MVVRAGLVPVELSKPETYVFEGEVFWEYGCEGCVCSPIEVWNDVGYLKHESEIPACEKFGYDKPAANVNTESGEQRIDERTHNAMCWPRVTAPPKAG